MNVSQPKEYEMENLITELMDRYGEDLVRLAYTYVKDHQIAEDILQDVFLKVFVHREQFRGQSSYKTYLYRITINRCYDYLRSAAYKKNRLLTTLNNIMKSTNNTEESVMRNSENYQIGEEILSLPLKDREVIILYYYKELSLDEIANLMECSINTVKTRLFRARLKLKNKLKGVGFNEEE